MPASYFGKRHLPKPKKGKVTGTNLEWGDYGIASEIKGIVSDKSLSSAFKTLQSILKKGGRHTFKIWSRKKPEIPITKKPLEVRMGKGIGSVQYRIARVRADQIIFEVSVWNSSADPVKALVKSSEKLGLPCFIIKK